jgi:hypothetical protein
MLAFESHERIFTHGQAGKNQLDEQWTFADSARFFRNRYVSFKVVRERIRL